MIIPNRLKMWEGSSNFGYMHVILNLAPDIMELQRTLSKLGYFKGESDSFLSRESKQAVNSYHKAKGVIEYNQIDKFLIERIPKKKKLNLLNAIMQLHLKNLCICNVLFPVSI